MAVLTPVSVAADGTIADLIAQLVAAAGGGDSYFGAGNEVIIVNNGGGGSINVTITASGADNFGTVTTAHDIVRSVGNGKIALINVNTMARFRDANSNVQIAYSGVTSVTIGVFRLGRSDR